jgi:hypothetical protein
MNGDWQWKGKRQGLNGNFPAFFHVFLLLFLSGSHKNSAIVGVAFVLGLHNIHVYTESRKFARKKRNARAKCIII